MNDSQSQSWIKKLNLIKHPEGGYYAEVFRSEKSISAPALAETHSGSRSALTSIYFLLPPGECSKFHRLKSDEIWYYHAGSSLTIHQILPNGTYLRQLLGPDHSNGEAFQHVMVANSWFGATVNDTKVESLVGCAVAPGFQFDDFELADRIELLKVFPQHKEVIEQLTN